MFVVYPAAFNLIMLTLHKLHLSHTRRAAWVINNAQIHQHISQQSKLIKRKSMYMQYYIYTYIFCIPKQCLYVVEVRKLWKVLTRLWQSIFICRFVMLKENVSNPNLEQNCFLGSTILDLNKPSQLIHIKTVTWTVVCRWRIKLKANEIH